LRANKYNTQTINMRFTLITKEDLPFLNETRNLVAKEFLHDSRSFALEETIDWFEKHKPNYWMIWVDDCRIGYFRLSNYSVENRNIYIGADIHPSYQGKGYGYESYLKFLPFLFEELSLHKITLEVLSSNKRAIHLYNKLGFVHEGAKRQEVLKEDAHVDSHIMSILRDEI
jgi:RimJ/RimL family protein N-acetyltransferase